jgi:hypothetical protein
LPNQAASSRANSGAHGEFTLPSGSDGKKHMGEVEGSDQQNHPGKRHQRQKRGAELRRVVLPSPISRRQTKVAEGIHGTLIFRVGAQKLLARRIDGSFSLRHPDARREARHDRDFRSAEQFTLPKALTDGEMRYSQFRVKPCL